MLSRFIFYKGKRCFEVMVEQRWTPELLQQTKIQTKNAWPLFLEKDDFTLGNDAFALDFFLMQETGEHLSGDNLLSGIKINKQALKLATEVEIRKLAASLRFAYFYRQSAPTKALEATLAGIILALEYLGHTTAEVRLASKLKAIFTPRVSTAELLQLLQKWEDLLTSPLAGETERGIKKP